MKRFVTWFLLCALMICSVLPTVHVEAAGLNAAKKTITVGDTYTLKVIGEDGAIKWSTSDKSVATVSKGKVTAKKPGTAEITATVNGTAYTSKITVQQTGIQVHMLDVNQGDAILIQVNNQNILIDTGEEKYYPELKEQLKHFGVKKIDTLVLTHMDSDHMGGADKLLKDYTVGKLYIPKRTNTTNEYKELTKALKDKKIEPINPEEGDTLAFGYKASAKVLSVDAGNDMNDSSIVLRLDYYKNSFLFTGDVSAEVENDILSEYDVDVDVLKVAHHGSDYSSPVLYISKVAPEYALISCGPDNQYGHPVSTVLKRLEKYSNQVYRTDKDGTITITGDGKTLTSKTEKLVEWEEKETKTTTEKTTETTTTGNIIGNKNSKVYHKPTCKSLPKESNRVYFESADSAKKSGYRACQNCHEYRDEVVEETTSAVGVSVIGNVNSKIYHIPTCRSVPKESNRRYFDSSAAAKNAGYRACQNCH